MVGSSPILDRLNSALAFYGDGYSGPPVSVSAFCQTAGVSRANLYQTYPDIVAEIRKRKIERNSNNPDITKRKVAVEQALRAEISMLNERIEALLLVCLENASVIDDLRIRLNAHGQKKRLE